VPAAPLLLLLLLLLAAGVYAPGCLLLAACCLLLLSGRLLWPTAGQKLRCDSKKKAKVAKSKGCLPCL
jgi:hypothetical protein